MNIDGYTRTCGVIGNPVEHTLSPVIHNTLAKAFAENLVYVPLRVPAGGLMAAVAGAWNLNLLGLNVTVPYKSEVIPFLQKLDPLAARIGAVNTLVRTQEGFEGYNTDMPGLYRAMCEDGVGIEGEKVLILGAGGVARAVAMLLVQKGADQVILMNRTLEKAKQIAGEVNQIAGRPLVSAMALADYTSLPEGDSFLAIQATNVGMYPKTDAAVIEDTAFYRKIHTGYDLVFNPARTKFMSLVCQEGGRAYNGLKMLLYQGVIAYELWTGVKVGQDLAGEVYAKMQRAMDL